MSKRLTNAELQSQVNDVTEKLDKVVDSTNAALDEVVVQVDSKFDALMEAIKAKDNPTSFTKTLEADEQDLGHEEPVEFGEVEIPKRRDYDSPEYKSKMEYEAYMQGKIRIQILDSSDKDADPNFMVSVNGDSYAFFRNQEYTVPRYIVETLARAKPIHYMNDEYVNKQGVLDSRLIPRKSLRYAFALVDPTPKDSAWLKGILAQPN